jgi:hypothetical protein
MNGITIPYGFTGIFTPPADVVGVLNPKSPVMNVPATGFWDPTTKLPAYPQFVTSEGQQIGSEFFKFGTYVGPFGVKPGAAGCGFLSDPFDQEKDYGKPNFFSTNVSAENGWNPIVGQPVVVLPAPGNVGQNKGAVGNQIKALVDTLVGMP